MHTLKTASESGNSVVLYNVACLALLRSLSTPASPPDSLPNPSKHLTIDHSVGLSAALQQHDRVGASWRAGEVSIFAWTVPTDTQSNHDSKSPVVDKVSVAWYL